MTIVPEEEDSRIIDTINFIRDEDETDFWEKELVDMHTLLMARKVLKNAFAPGGLPSQILQPVLKKLEKFAKTNLLKYSK